MRKLLPALAIVAVLALPAAAAAKGPASVHVKSCRTGAHASDRKATFKAWMRAVHGTSRMSLRFSLVGRRPGRSAEHVDAPAKLRRWHTSHEGVVRYGYSQTVKRLEQGTSYRMVVHFRWYDADGHTIKRAKRTSGDCDQLSDLPNLVLAGITIDNGPETTHYGVSVRNKGDAAAGSFVVKLIVDGALVNKQTVDGLDPGTTTVVEFNGPPCETHFRAVADSHHDIVESDEDDNASSGACPQDQSPSRR